MNAEGRSLAPWQTGLLLATFAAVCAAAVGFTWELTRERIAANRQALREQQFLPVLAGVAYDTLGLDEPVQIAPPHDLPGREPALIYFASDGDGVAACLFEVSADGYAGQIRLLIGISADGIVTGVRALEHRETPGLGDKIEASRSDWITRFEGLSLDDPPPAQWALENEGGRFEQFTGATITARAVVRAVKSTLLYFAEHRSDLLQEAPVQAGSP